MLNRHFLVVSTTGLGDTLWATPALRALRRRWPEAKISVMTTRLGKEVLKGCRAVDHFFVVGDGLFSFFGPLRKLRRERVDTALIFHTSQRFALPVCALCGIERIVGTQGLNKGLDGLLTVALKGQRCHEIERRLEIVRAVGGEEVSPLLEMGGEKRAKRSEVVVGIHPGAKDTFKQYPPEYFIQVARALKQLLKCQIVITGGPEEKGLVEGMCAQVEGAISLAGGLTIGELAGEIGAMDLFITNDTGPMHVAFAVQTPTVALFCPTDPALCGPYRAEKVRVLSKERTCRPCLKKKCRDPFCMRQIPVLSIVKAAKELIDE